MTPYDLANPPALRADERERLALAARRTAQALETVGCEFLRARLGVTLVSVAEERCPKTPIGDPDVWVVAAGDAQDRAPVWRLDGGLAKMSCDLMVGLRGGRGERGEPSLTRLERRLVAHLCGELSAGLGGVWPTPLALPDQYRCLRPGAGLSEPSAREWVRLGYQVRCADLRGELDLYLPLTQAKLARPSAPRGALSPEVVERCGVGAAPIRAAVCLGTWHTSLREVLNLRKGQVVELGVPPQANLLLSMAGLPRMAVRPGTHQGYLAVQVLGWAKEE